MRLELTLREELASGADAVALACMDTRSGLLLGLEVRDVALRDDVELATLSAAQICSVPAPDAELHEDCDESFVASARWVHAYARVPERKDLVMVGLAPGHANIALLRAWLRQIAGRVGPHA